MTRRKGATFRLRDPLVLLPDAGIRFVLVREDGGRAVAAAREDQAENRNDLILLRRQIDIAFHAEIQRAHDLIWIRLVCENDNWNSHRILRQGLQDLEILVRLIVHVPQNQVGVGMFRGNRQSIASLDHPGNRGMSIDLADHGFASTGRRFVMIR